MSDRLTRRDVLRNSAVVAAGAAFSGALASTEPKKTQPEDRLRVGIIGCGGKGWSGREWAAEYADIVALCDIDVRDRVKAMEVHPRASSFDDYRDMIAAMKGKMDAVVISVPDHHHAPAAALAMKAGLHTYCEKPLTRTIWEARQLANIARKMKVATQMGNQSTASTNMRKVAQLIKQGHFGHVKQVHVWTNRAKVYWKQGIERPAVSAVPKEVDFDTWLGPRPARPYGEGYHPFSWRGWWDFGTGALGDMACHLMNTPHMALDLSRPHSVQATTSGHNRDSFPDWSKVHYVYAPTKDRPGFDVFWYDGGQKPDQALAEAFPYGGNGNVIVCEKDTIYNANEGNTEYYLTSGQEFPDVKIDESPGHMAEFIRAAMGGPAARSNFPDYAGPMTEAILLGNLAIWANGPTLEWDAKNMKVKGTNEYDALIKPEYQPGWAKLV